VFAALVVGPGRQDCPRPSAKSIAALFSPCQASTMAMATLVKEPSSPEEILAEERQVIAREHHGWVAR
jgi:hypothetical protein